MTDHPSIFELDEIRINEGLNPRANAALETAAAALRALAEFRPHHPQAIVGRRYASLVVSYEALRAAQDVLGDFDLGPTDVNALRQRHDDDRQAHNAMMSRDEIVAKWGR